MAYIGFDIENRLHNTAFTFDSYTSDGFTSIYALSVPKPLTSRAILVSFDGLTQQPELDYTLDGESNLKIINVPVIHTQMQILHLTRPVQLHTIPDKSISSSKFVGDLQTPGDLIVGGKLTILGSGEEEVSTVFPALSVQASTILINADESGSGVAVGSAGIKIDRGQLPDKSFVWDDTVDKWSTEGETLLATGDGSATLNVLKAGDTMTGELTLSGDPTGEDSAATKSYVDRQALVSSLLF